MKKKTPNDEAVRFFDPLSQQGQARRNFLAGTGGGAAAAALGLGTASTSTAQSQAPAQSEISFVINGQAISLQVEDRWTLVEVIRDQLDLTGTKVGCNRSECGACTVIMNGQPVYSCSQLAVWADGAEIQTVEGLAQNGALSPLQNAFVENNGPQCGFCTSGQLMTATALLNNNPNPSADEVKSALVGNLCRCSNYNAIVEAVVEAGEQQSGQGGVA